MKPNSDIRLNDPASVRKDDKGLSPAFFCIGNQARVSRQLINELKAASHEAGNRPVRICLHADPSESLHDMVVLITRDGYYPPHKHSTKSESYHIIDGRAAIFLFDDSGAITDACVLEPSSNFIYRVGINVFHTMVPLTETLVYHESRPGPFAPEGDSIFPNWAPERGNTAAGAEFTRKLLAQLTKPGI